MDFRKFFNASELKKEIVEGNVERCIYTGENIQLVEYHFPPRKTFPPHKHDDHEQMGYLVSGTMEFTIGGETRLLQAGDYYHAPVGTLHNTRTLDEAAVLIDVFSPPRDDLR